MATESMNLMQVKEKLEAKDSFVLNIVAAWCPDCTEKQVANLERFAELLSPSSLDVINLEVQKEKRVYLSREHDDFVEGLGGHGFPRTALFINGQPVDSDNVEVLSLAELIRLAERFIAIVNKG